MTLTPLGQLHLNLLAMTVYSPNAGDPDVDARIADVLSVTSLPYTSDDADAQTLKPAGWSWDLDDQENIICVRDSDGALAWGVVLNEQGSDRADYSVTLEHCFAAINAWLVETDDVS